MSKSEGFFKTDFWTKIRLQEQFGPRLAEFLMRCFSFRGQSIKVASFFKEARVIHCLTGPLDVLVHYCCNGNRVALGKKPICDTHKVCQGENRRTMTNIRNDGMMTTQFQKYFIWGDQGCKLSMLNEVKTIGEHLAADCHATHQ